MTIITQFYNKIKLFVTNHLEEVGVSIIIILVAISSFLLGKSSVTNDKTSQGKITFKTEGSATPSLKISPTESASLPKTNTEDAKVIGQVVASKTGTRYYLPWCASAERILPKNKVFFASALDAEKAGLTKAANCKGM